MILKNKNKIRNVVLLTIISFCVLELAFLPMLIDGQNNNDEIVYSIELINDLIVRSRIFNKKGVLMDIGDVHYFQVALKQDIEYVSRLKITANFGGTFLLALYGVTTQMIFVEALSTPVTNHVVEILYTADGTTTGELVITYIPLGTPEFPTYTLYFNKAGFAGWWWIILSGIGALAILAFIFTFMVIGLISVSKRKKKGKKRKKKKR